MVRVFPFGSLPVYDRMLDPVYEGAPGGQLSGEALSKLIPGVGNLGGFRSAARRDSKQLVVLYTSGEDPDWPVHLDLSTGQFVYCGGNRTTGHELHDTGQGGKDIADILMTNGYNTPELVKTMLQNEFEVTPS